MRRTHWRVHFQGCSGVGKYVIQKRKGKLLQSDSMRVSDGRLLRMRVSSGRRAHICSCSDQCVLWNSPETRGLCVYGVCVCVLSMCGKLNHTTQRCAARCYVRHLCDKPHSTKAYNSSRHAKVTYSVRQCLEAKLVAVQRFPSCVTSAAACVRVWLLCYWSHFMLHAACMPTRAV